MLAVYMCRNFEISLRQHSIINGMHAHNAQNEQSAHAQKYNFLATTGLVTKSRILASRLIRVAGSLLKKDTQTEGEWVCHEYN